MLRAICAALVERCGCAWAGIRFVERGELVLGPEHGAPRPERRSEAADPLPGRPRRRARRRRLPPSRRCSGELADPCSRSTASSAGTPAACRGTRAPERRPPLVRPPRSVLPDSSRLCMSRRSDELFFIPMPETTATPSAMPALEAPPRCPGAPRGSSSRAAPARTSPAPGCPPRRRAPAGSRRLGAPRGQDRP